MSIAIAIHGGAGVIRRADLDAEKEKQFRAGLAESVEAGHAVLRQGGSALDAVIAAVMAMEDNPLFNAGRGAVFTLDGTQEMEAAVMDGAAQDAGSVTGLTRVAHPVLVARRVMERSPHVTLGFAAADAFARDEGFESMPPGYHFTEHRWRALLEERARMAQGGTEANVPEDRKHGTVGAVALDAQGRLAAATSTGGRTAKWPGRIGDTPIIGAGTWADDHCAVSCTGHGESFVRVAAAHDLAARMAYLGASLQEAGDAVIHGALARIGGSGGLVAVDARGRVAMPFNSEGMYRASVDGDGCRRLAIFDDEP